MRIVAVVGMNGSGKSEVARLFEKKGFVRIRFGDVTDKEVTKRGLPLNEENERRVREELRREHGMAAYAILNIPVIDAAHARAPVVLDGLYSWQEYKLLKSRYGEDMVTVAVYSSPRTRQARTPGRQVRPLSPEESAKRDENEIENLDKGGPIAVADFTLVNESSFEDLARQTEALIEKLR